MNKILLMSLLTTLCIGCPMQIMSSEQPKKEQQQLRQLAMERMERDRQKEQLKPELELAIQSKNIKWIKEKRSSLISLRIITSEEFDKTIRQLTDEIQRQEQPVPSTIAPSQGFSDDEELQEVRQLSKLRYKAALSKDFQRASETGDIEWLKQNKTAVAQQGIELLEVINGLIEAFEEPLKAQAEKAQIIAREREEAAQFKRERERKEHQACIAYMKSTKSIQGMVERLAKLYNSLVGKDSNFDQLQKVTKIQNLGELFAQLKELTKNPSIIAAIGEEIQLLASYMQFGVWSSLQDLDKKPHQAFEAFQEAAGKRDFTAMINLYRNFLQQNESLRKEVLSIVFDILMNATDKNDLQALIDSYLYFFKGSEQQETALMFLNEYAQKLLAHRDLENLKKLLVVFENTEYERDINDAAVSLTLEIGQQLPEAAPATTGSQLPRQVLYDEWMGARSQLNLERLFELRDEVVRQGIETADMADAIIHSVAQTLE